MAGLRYRVLGDVCNPCGRAVRNQYQKYGNHNCSEYGTGLVPVMILAFDCLKGSFSVIESAAIVGVVVFGLAFYSSLTISETHNKDLEFTE